MPIDGGVRFYVQVNIDARWTPEQITAFFAGITAIQVAAKLPETGEPKEGA